MLTTAIIAIRRSRLEPLFADKELDAILVTNLANVRYLSGFTGSDGVLFILRSGKTELLVDSRYTGQAEIEAVAAKIRLMNSRVASLAELVKEHGVNRLGVESAHLTMDAQAALTEALPAVALIPLNDNIDRARACKDRGELECLTLVAELASASLQAVLPLFKVGARECDLAMELEFEMRRRGAQGRSFDFIIASGVRGAMPHGVASAKKLVAGELVTVDFGAVLDGYCSDETVTLAVGSPDSELRRIHAIVLKAHDLAIAAVRPGASCREIDAIAREHIAAAGFAGNFGHGLGHGIGLEVHEAPTLSTRSETVLAAGMVCTVEPGIYIPGLGGVRIEDTVVVTDSGCRIITRFPKELLVL